MREAAAKMREAASVKRPRSVYDEEMDYDRRRNEEMAEIEGAPTPVKYVPRKKPGFKISRPKLGEETTPNHVVTEPDAPQFNMPNIGGGNAVTPVDIGNPDVPALPTAEVKAPKMSPASLGNTKRDPLFDTPTPMPSNVKAPEFKSTLDVLPELPRARKAQPLTGGEANAWRANAAAALGKAAPGVAGIGAGLRGGMKPSTPAPADAPVVRPKSNRPALGSVADRRAVYAKAGQPVDAPIVRSSRSAETRKTQEATAPAAAAARPRALSVRDITAADMRKYRKYTAAGNMNSEMDRWKTLQAMQGNRNASNKDYRAAKKRGEVK